ncbi:MAG: transcriptional regulator, TetR family [Frankiales bacterium]|nr:transcriptional regulator, TetR family [Frankiales bacterium]
MTTEHLSRDERRRRTEAAILAGARELFAHEGFERTTIRAVAARASVDPALVMQYFGSKEGLFAASAKWDAAHERVLSSSAADLPHAALEDLLDRFEDVEGGEAAVALMRSCLTHPVATRVMRDEVMCERKDAVEAALEGDDAALRAGVFAAVMMGLSMARYLLEVQPVSTATREELHRVVEPLLRVLVEPPPSSSD